jgi:hypothetical protein
MPVRHLHGTGSGNFFWSLFRLPAPHLCGNNPLLIIREVIVSYNGDITFYIEKPTRDYTSEVLKKRRTTLGAFRQQAANPLT